MSNINHSKRIIRRLIRPKGWEVRQYDPDLSLDAFLWMLFKHYQINCVLDIGARFGDYGVLLRNNDYQGHILSFEPIASNYEILQKQSAKDPFWRTYAFALGSEDTASAINVTKETNFSSFLTPSKYGGNEHQGNTIRQTEEVQVRRLDTILAEITAHIDKPRIYLKMDTQGWDIEVLRGAAGCLDLIIALQSEMSLQPLYDGMTNWITALSEFNAKGFAVSGLFAGFRDSHLLLSEMDCVMVRNV